MSISIENSCPPPSTPAPWLWNKRIPIMWQVVFTIALAFSVIVVIYLVAPEMALFAKKIIHTWAHESGHYVSAELGPGSASAMVINADGSGHVQTQSSSPLHRIIISALGNIWPVILSAYFLYIGITRQFMHISIFILGCAIALSTYAFGFEEKVSLILYGWAIVCVVAALVPTDAILASIVSVLIGIILFLGAVDNIDYLFLDYINNDPARPSDSQKIADITNAGSLQEVGNVILMIVISIYAVFTLLSIHWLSQRRFS